MSSDTKELDYSRYTHLIEEATETLNKLYGENTELLGLNSKLSEEKKKLDTDIKLIATGFRDLNQQLQEEKVSDQGSAQHDETIKSLEKDLNKAREQLQKQKEKVLGEESARHNETIESLRNKLENAQKKLQEQSQKMHSAQETITAKIKAAQQEQQGQQQQLNLKIAELNTELHEATENLQKCDAENKRISEAATKANKKLEAATEDLQNCKAKNERISKAATKANQKLEAATKDLQNCKAEKASLEETALQQLAKTNKVMDFHSALSELCAFSPYTLQIITEGRKNKRSHAMFTFNKNKTADHSKLNENHLLAIYEHFEGKQDEANFKEFAFQNFMECFVPKDDESGEVSPMETRIDILTKIVSPETNKETKSTSKIHSKKWDTPEIPKSTTT